MKQEKYSAILLIGPTGSGKTPLGNQLEEKGMRGRRCHHFDFGHQLRTVGNIATRPNFLSNREQDVVQRSLRTGSLLDDSHFPIARKIFLDFIHRKSILNDDLLILNGLPRHRGQSEKMDELVLIKGVINLSCTPETVLDRIRMNTGGDRSGRIDDAYDNIVKKLQTFNERTEPLLEYYRSNRIAIFSIHVTADLRPETIRTNLNNLSFPLYSFSKLME
jgi:adenylate kinase